MNEKKQIRLTLPLPTSVNCAYAGKEVRYKSKDYKLWIEEAMISALAQKKYKITGDEWLEVDYHYYTHIYNKNGGKKIWDVFNFEKTLSDLLAGKKKKGIWTQPPIIDGFQDHKIITGRVTKHESDRQEVEIIISEVTEFSVSDGSC